MSIHLISLNFSLCFHICIFVSIWIGYILVNSTSSSKSKINIPNEINAKEVTCTFDHFIEEYLEIVLITHVSFNQSLCPNTKWSSFSNVFVVILTLITILIFIMVTPLIPVFKEIFIFTLELLFCVFSCFISILIHLLI